MARGGDLPDGGGDGDSVLLRGVVVLESGPDLLQGLGDDVKRCL